MYKETVRSRFRKAMNGEMPSDRLPVMEWASWWDLTVNRWRGEGLNPELGWTEIKEYFDLDVDFQIWLPQTVPTGMPRVCDSEVGAIRIAKDYDAILPSLYPNPIGYDRNFWARAARQQAEGSAITWITLSGFFWWPRVLFGIEPHLYAFYDEPDLMHRINQDQVGFMKRALDDICSICVPDFMTFGEDMSYNHGPMISKDQFDEFMAPYYLQIVPLIKERGITPIIDSDGFVEPLIPWFEAVGIEGILPLERMAGVDVNRIENHPNWKMIGAFDKTVMQKGEAAIRAEFDRLMPVMKSGRFVPSVDHQTHPGVSMQDYLLYLNLLREYAEKACQ